LKPHNFRRSGMGVNRRVIDNRKPLLFSKGGSLKRNG
jgi:hypothetical protein